MFTSDWSTRSSITTWWQSSVATRDPATNQLVMPPQKKTVILVPTSVLLKWESEFRAWTILGDRLLVTNKVEELTEQAIEAALVIIVTPEALTNVYKTFAYDSENPNEGLEDEDHPDGIKKKKKTRQSTKWMRDRIKPRLDAKGNKVYQLHKNAVSKLDNTLIIVDEAHNIAGSERGNALQILIQNHYYLAF